MGNASHVVNLHIFSIQPADELHDFGLDSVSVGRGLVWIGVMNDDVLRNLKTKALLEQRQTSRVLLNDSDKVKVLDIESNQVFRVRVLKPLNPTKVLQSQVRCDIAHAALPLAVMESGYYPLHRVTEPNRKPAWQTVRDVFDR